MRKHVLIFVHGMGVYVHPDGKPDHNWSHSAAQALKEQYDKYQVATRKSFDSTFEIVHINYDLEFHKLVTRWAEEAASVGALQVAAPAVKKLVGWLDGAAATDGNFAWSHFSDVVLYKFFPLMRQRIKSSVATQFQAALAPNAHGAVASWSVIAHSLGTIIAHDALHAMDSTTPNEAGISILDAMAPSASVIAMIANVCKVMQTDVDVYRSLVVPASLVQHQSACFQYLNCRNSFDPFVLVDPFKPHGPAWELASANHSYLDITIENIHELDVHSLRNYLVNPLVHIPLLERLLGEGTIADHEKTQAFAGFEQIADQALVDASQKISARLSEADWFEQVGQYFAAIGAAK